MPLTCRYTNTFRADALYLGMTVICPSDDMEAKTALKAAYRYVSPLCIRFGRQQFSLSVEHIADIVEDLLK
jgi:transketolase C-terminal domain/subunit